MITIIDDYKVLINQKVTEEEKECIKLAIGYALMEHELDEASVYNWNIAEWQKDDFKVQYDNDTKRLSITHEKTSNEMIELIDTWMKIREEEIELGL